MRKTIVVCRVKEGRNRLVTVEADVVDGLAVHRDTYLKTWLLTHLESGHAMGSYKLRKRALRLRDKLVASRSLAPLPRRKEGETRWEYVKRLGTLPEFRKLWEITKRLREEVEREAD